MKSSLRLILRCTLESVLSPDKGPSFCLPHPRPALIGGGGFKPPDILSAPQNNCLRGGGSKVLAAVTMECSQGGLKCSQGNNRMATVGSDLKFQPRGPRK